MLNKRLNLTYYEMGKDNIENLIKNFISSNKPKIVGRKGHKYLNVSASFDIETSSFYTGEEKTALMYIWQFGLYDVSKQETLVIVGREWLEFNNLMNIFHKILPDKVNLIVYVHNLAYEYTFLNRQFPLLKDKTFFVKPNTPLYATFGCIEFRCSYLLSGYSLANLDTKTKKLKGDLDYSLIRHSKTPLTDDEMAYCINDVRIVCEYIYNKMQQENDDISKIPHTKTGYVRRGLKQACIGDDFMGNQRKAYAQRTQALQLDGIFEYSMLKLAYTGGFTGCNPEYYDKIITDIVECQDFSSSYPSQVCEPEFPVSYVGFEQKMLQKDFEQRLQFNAMYGMAIFTNIRAKHIWSTSISYSKCWELDIDSEELNNGKLYKANMLKIVLTNIDYKTIKSNYDFDEVRFEGIFIYDKGYLPKPVVEFILDKYIGKTTLKGIKGREAEYANKKEDNNSIYGCAVTDRCKFNIIEDEDGNCTYDDSKSEEELIDAYNKRLWLGTEVLPYQWGIYISALARYKLWLGINACNENFIYSDTDSIYFIPNQDIYDFINAYNSMIERKFIALCEKYDLPKDIWKPKTIKGVEKPLGFWDFDGQFTKFKTLGAKRYIKQELDGNIKITVAGLGKTQGRDYLVKNFKDPFQAFTEGLTIPKGETGKMTHTIIKHTIKGQVTDYLGNTVDFVSNGGTHLEDCSFEMSIEKSYVKFLNGIEENYEMGY